MVKNIKNEIQLREDQEKAQKAFEALDAEITALENKPEINKKDQLIQFFDNKIKGFEDDIEGLSTTNTKDYSYSSSRSNIEKKIRDNQQLIEKVEKTTKMAEIEKLINKYLPTLATSGGGSRKKRSRKARKSIRKKWKLIKHKSIKKKGRRKYTKRK